MTNTPILAADPEVLICGDLAPTKAPLLVDVRTPDEYAASHVAGAINVPLAEFTTARVLALSTQQPILTIRETGRRARLATRIIHGVLPGVEVATSPVHLRQLRAVPSLAGSADVGSWAVDRQFRLLLGLVLATAAGLLPVGATGGVAIIAVMATGLTFTSLIDRCFLREALGRLPWNRGAANDRT